MNMDTVQDTGSDVNTEFDGCDAIGPEPGYVTDGPPPEYDRPAYQLSHGHNSGPIRLSDRKSGLGVDVPKSKPFALSPLLFLKVKAPDFIIHGLLETNSFAAIIGDPGSAKSFLAIDVACCVATGETFHGRAIRKQGPVVYIAGEGQSGLARRFSAWGIKHGINYKEIPVFVSMQPGQLTDDACTSAIIDAIEALPEPPRLIVIDTLARNFGPGDENSASDMNGFIQSVDRIREHANGATMLIVHHCGLADKRRGRGSSALRGALDAEYIISKDEHGVRRFECCKMKDAPAPDPMAFDLRSVELGMNDDHGYPVTSAVLVATEYTEQSAPGVVGKGKNQNIGCDILDSLISRQMKTLSESGYPTENASVRRDDWKKECLKNMKKNSFYVMEKSLREQGMISIANGFVRYVGG